MDREQLISAALDVFVTENGGLDEQDAKICRLIAERFLALESAELSRLRGEVERLTTENGVLRDSEAWAIRKLNDAEAQVERLTKEQDEARRLQRDALDKFLVEGNRVAESIAALSTKDEAIAELLGALEPFEEAAGDLDDETRDGSNIWEMPAAMSIEAGHLRRAAQVRAKWAGVE